MIASVKSDKVLLSEIVSEWFFVVELMQHQEFGFSAVMIPPLQPIAGRYRKFCASCGGRKVFTLKRSISWSLVSWIHMIVGLAEIIASRTTLHLSRSPNPRTFQDRAERERFELELELLITKQVAPKVQGNIQITLKVFGN